MFFNLYFAVTLLMVINFKKIENLIYNIIINFQTCLQFNFMYSIIIVTDRGLELLSSFYIRMAPLKV